MEVRMSKARNKKDMYTSVSAITDADGCMRRWWLNKVVKLPQKQRKATIFGDVLHAVCERYLLGDDRGLDAKGHPVNLYPEGWMSTYNRFDKTKTMYTISDTEAVLIKALIEQAIIQGVLVREPGRIIEKQFEVVIYSKGFAKAVLRGFEDMYSPHGITDQKTCKVKKYALSKAKLRKSIQMMGYGKAEIILGHQGTIWLTHNNFIKNFEKPEVIQRSIEVSQIEVELFFNDTILPIVRRMMDYYLKYPQTHIHQWRNIPGADDPSSCNYHYGASCPYIMICSGVGTIDNYLRPFNLTVNELVGNEIFIQKKVESKIMNNLVNKTIAENAARAADDTTPAVAAPVVAAPVETVPVAVVEPVLDKQPAPTGILSTLKNAAAAVVNAVKSTPAVVPVESPTAEAPVVAVAPATAAPAVIAEQQTAPWYTDYNNLPCPACMDAPIRGYTNNLPCRICDIRAAELDRPTSLDYDVTILDGGVLSFTLKTGEAPAVEVTIVPPPVVTSVAEPVALDPTPATLAVAVTDDASILTTVISPAPVVEPPAFVSSAKPITSVINPEVLDRVKANFLIADTAPVAAPAIETPAFSAEEIAEKSTAFINAHKPMALPAPATEGFDLLIGCSFVSSKNGAEGAVVYAEAILNDMLIQIAAAAGKAHFSAVDHFALIQAVEAYVPSIVPGLNGVTVISAAPSKGSAHARMIDGLRMEAETVVQPFAV